MAVPLLGNPQNSVQDPQFEQVSFKDRLGEGKRVRLVI